MESVFARLCHCAFTLIEVCGVHPCTMLKNRHPWSLASWNLWILSSKFSNIIGRKLFDLTNLEDPYNLILILWWGWMESTSCSLPRQHWFGEGYHSFLHFPQSIRGEIFNSKNSLNSPTTYLRVAGLEFTRVRIYFDLDDDDFLLFTKTTWVW